jgi:hypothetical protein
MNSACETFGEGIPAGEPPPRQTPPAQLSEEASAATNADEEVGKKEQAGGNGADSTPALPRSTTGLSGLLSCSSGSLESKVKARRLIRLAVRFAYFRK